MTSQSHRKVGLRCASSSLSRGVKCSTKGTLSRVSRAHQQPPTFRADLRRRVAVYVTDITRSWPVEGTFTPRQAELYDAVLAAQKAGIATGQGSRARVRAGSKLARHRARDARRHSRAPRGVWHQLEAEELQALVGFLVGQPQEATAAREQACAGLHIAAARHGKVQARRRGAAVDRRPEQLEDVVGERVGRVDDGGSIARHQDVVGGRARQHVAPGDHRTTQERGRAAAIQRCAEELEATVDERIGHIHHAVSSEAQWPFGALDRPDVSTHHEGPAQLHRRSAAVAGHAEELVLAVGLRIGEVQDSGAVGSQRDVVIHASAAHHRSAELGRRSAAVHGNSVELPGFVHLLVGEVEHAPGGGEAHVGAWVAFDGEANVAARDERRVELDARAAAIDRGAEEFVEQARTFVGHIDDPAAVGREPPGAGGGGSRLLAQLHGWGAAVERDAEEIRRREKATRGVHDTLPVRSEHEGTVEAVAPRPVVGERSVHASGWHAPVGRRHEQARGRLGRQQRGPGEDNLGSIRAEEWLEPSRRGHALVGGACAADGHRFTRRAQGSPEELVVGVEAVLEPEYHAVAGRADDREGACLVAPVLLRMRQRSRRVAAADAGHEELAQSISVDSEDDLQSIRGRLEPGDPTDDFALQRGRTQCGDEAALRRHRLQSACPFGGQVRHVRDLRSVGARVEGLRGRQDHRWLASVQAHARQAHRVGCLEGVDRARPVRQDLETVEETEAVRVGAIEPLERELERRPARERHNPQVVHPAIAEEPIRAPGLVVVEARRAVRTHGFQEQVVERAVHRDEGDACSARARDPEDLLRRAGRRGEEDLRGVRREQEIRGDAPGGGELGRRTRARARDRVQLGDGVGVLVGQVGHARSVGRERIGDGHVPSAHRRRVQLDGRAGSIRGRAEELEDLVGHAVGAERDPGFAGIDAEVDHRARSRERGVQAHGGLARVERTTEELHHAVGEGIGQVVDARGGCSDREGADVTSGGDDRAQEDRRARAVSRDAVELLALVRLGVGEEDDRRAVRGELEALQVAVRLQRAGDQEGRAAAVDRHRIELDEIVGGGIRQVVDGARVRRDREGRVHVAPGHEVAAQEERCRTLVGRHGQELVDAPVPRVRDIDDGRGVRAVVEGPNSRQGLPRQWPVQLGLSGAAASQKRECDQEPGGQPSGSALQRQPRVRSSRRRYFKQGHATIHGFLQAAQHRARGEERGPCESIATQAIRILSPPMASLSDLQERSRGIQERLAQLKEGL
ncbi:MAG: M24 family metallopeptidase [Planctomycetota bacterium]